MYKVFILVQEGLVDPVYKVFILVQEGLVDPVYKVFTRYEQKCVISSYSIVNCLQNSSWFWTLILNFFLCISAFLHSKFPSFSAYSFPRSRFPILSTCWYVRNFSICKHVSIPSKFKYAKVIEKLSKAILFKGVCAKVYVKFLRKNCAINFLLLKAF